jgi:hypothetical protein
MRKKYYILITCFVLLVSGTAWALYLYNKPHQNVAGLRPAFRIDGADLYSEYRRDEAAANQKFTNKVLEVKGVIAGEQFTDSTVNIQLSTGEPDAVINCNFLVKDPVKPHFPSKGAAVAIKGRCTGFLEDVNLVDCVID